MLNLILGYGHGDWGIGHWALEWGGVGGVGGWGRNLSPHTLHTPHTPHTPPSPQSPVPSPQSLLRIIRPFHSVNFPL
ncbi:MAG: hypothetical protein RM338_14890 [Nostoc sp. DedQUE12a]|nr:hypothetical protein [Nostoc sp. DedQUE12a]